MIETDQQRRWWFPTHPEYSSSQGGKRSKGRSSGKESDNISPASVDAYVDERLKYEKDSVITELLKLTKFWFGNEFASKTPAEKHALLWGDEESPKGFDELTGRYAKESESSLITRLPAVSNDGHVLHIDMFDSEEAYADEVYRRATELDKMGLVRDPHTALDVLFRLKSIASPLVSIRRLLQRLARGSVVSATKKAATRGSGKWVETARRGGPSLQHQSSMSGQTIRERQGKFYIKEYELNKVKFDDFRDGKLYEYKGRHAHLFDKQNEFHQWVNDPQALRDQALRQVKAAQGIPVIWRVGSNQVKAFQKALGNIRGLKIVP